MTFQLLISHSSNPNLCLSLSLSSYNFRPKAARTNNIPARDIVIGFGKHKGKMLGTLPSNYLKWVSKTLRARDFEHWAKLADQVLQDPVYQDRIEWELAENVLHGNNARVTTNDSSLSGNESGGAVSMLLEISERFGWYNEDKAGWSKVNFELLGTSKSGRIPRVAETKRNGSKEKEVKVVKEVKPGDGALGEKRRERRERVRMKREDEESKLEDKQNKSLGSLRHGVDKDQTVEIYNPFPGREALLNKVANNRGRFL